MRLLLFVLVIFVAGAAWPGGFRPWVMPEAYPTFHVVVADAAADSEKLAAHEFARYWKQTTGCDVPVESRRAIQGVNVWIGPKGVPRALLAQLDLEGLGDDGLCIETVGETDLLIVGGPGRGTLYGVYQFLEDYLGVRWLTPDVTYIPDAPPAALPAIDMRFVPVFAYRYSTYLMREKNIDYYRQVHRYVEGPGFSAHTFYSFVPPAEYYPDHPEYFSEVDGKRIAPWDFNWGDVSQLGTRSESRGQLCMTNPDVIALITHKVRERIQANPQVKSIHISQMDWFNYCQCDRCKAIDEREGSHMGATLWGLNQIADAVDKEFPGYEIETLAYLFTRKPPKHLKPRDNLAVKLCSIECDFGRPLAERKSKLNRVFAEDIRRWSKIAKRLHVWDYTANFRNFQTPHPNFHVLQPNLQFFAEHNVKGVFEQGCYDRGGEFAYLRAYLLSKLMWNPYADADAIMNEFIDLYYREAAPYIKEYLALITDKVVDEGIFMGCFDEGRWMDYDMVEQAEAVFAKAFAAAESEETRRRLEAAYIPVQYAALVCPPRVHLADNTFSVRRPPSLTLEEYTKKLRDYDVITIVDFFPFEDFVKQVGGSTPPREQTSPLRTLENERYLLWVAPGMEGSILRWRDKKLGVELLRGYEACGQGPGTWQEWVNTPGTPEHAIAPSYEVVKETADTLGLRAASPNGIVVERRMTLAPGSDALEVTLTYSNPTDKPLVAQAKIHPEFYTQGASVPEIWADDGAQWSRLNPDASPEQPVVGKILEGNGLQRWAFRIPRKRLTVVNEFKREEVGGLLYFYNVTEHARHVNLELLPPKDPIAPGQQRSMAARYIVTRRKPTDLWKGTHR
jgi:hypothetical protein